MLCPAVLDPFEGSNYRLAAVVHQGILCPLLCKIICFLCTPRGTIVITKSKQQSPKHSCTISQDVVSSLMDTNEFAQLNLELEKKQPQLACDNIVRSDSKNLAESGYREARKDLVEGDLRNIGANQHSGNCYVTEKPKQIKKLD